MKKLLVVFIVFYAYLSFSWAVVPENVEEQEKIHSAIEHASEHVYQPDDLQILEKWASNGNAQCQLCYGEYLLHKTDLLHEAAAFIFKAAEQGESDAKNLIESVIGTFSEFSDGNIKKFCQQWPSINRENKRFLAPTTAASVALYFLSKDHQKEERDLTPLKLQKMVSYFAQGCHAAIYGFPLFSDEVTAWLHGPVVESIYQEYKHFGSSVITLPEHDLQQDLQQQLSDETCSFLDAIYEITGKYAAWTLSNAAHKPGSPWHQVWDGEKGKNRTIPLNLMYSYFKKLKITQMVKESIGSKRPPSELSEVVDSQETSGPPEKRAKE